MPLYVLPAKELCTVPTASCSELAISIYGIRPIRRVSTRQVLILFGCVLVQEGAADGAGHRIAAVDAAMSDGAAAEGDHCVGMGADSEHSHGYGSDDDFMEATEGQVR